MIGYLQYKGRCFAIPDDILERLAVPGGVYSINLNEMQFV